jgi:hypothetical protein
MKLTKNLLRQLIKEQMSQDDFRKQQIAQAREKQTGIDGKEREFLSSVIEKLKKIATVKNLSSAGQLTTLLRRLDKEMDKMLSTSKVNEEMSIIFNEQEGLDLSKLEPTVEKATADVLSMAKSVSPEEEIQRMIIAALIAKLNELVK